MPASQINESIHEIQRRIAELNESLAQTAIDEARRSIPGCAEEVERVENAIAHIQSTLTEVPPIEVSVLGPSRHGKSTLLNALIGQDLLPTSDTKPCTASILKLRWAKEWSLIVKFVSKEVLVDDWATAVKEAEDYLRRQNVEEKGTEAVDDPRYFLNTIHRFVELFGLDDKTEPIQLLEQVKKATIPKTLAKLIRARAAKPNTNSLEALKGLVAKYLSTKDVLWTIVESCEISGPFEGWHHHLSLSDLPGTNDTNPHRTAITNSVRENSQAVAIVTREGNLGNDIESWLRNSTVMSEFLEAKSSRRQHLFIIRTNLDNYQPRISEEALIGADEEKEEELFTEAFEKYKVEQAAAYHGMLKDIIMPLLPASSDDVAMNRKREELLARIGDVQVHFVSALAHEVFAGRYSVIGRTRRQFEELFHDDINETGVPGLLAYVNQIAADYLSVNFYDDILRRLEREATSLAEYFQREENTIQAELVGAGESVRGLVIHVKSEVLPWVQRELPVQVGEFRVRASLGGREIKQRLRQAHSMAERRFQDKTEKWCNYAWNTLKATARKGGSHTKYDGSHVDIVQDICSVLVDDLIVTWTTYRDFLIEQRIDEMTDQFARQLVAKLRESAQQTDVPEAIAAMEAIQRQLEGITYSQRGELLRKVNATIKRMESIRSPAYEHVRDKLKPIFTKIQNESGAGCQKRMQNHLMEGFRNNIDEIREYISSLVENAIHELLDTCVVSFTDFGSTASSRISKSIQHLAETQRISDETQLRARQAVVGQALLALPSPSH